jgi:hypothetical protein
MTAPRFCAAIHDLLAMTPSKNASCALVALTALVAAVQAPGVAQQRTFEGQPAVVLSNDKLEVIITTLGSTLASIVVADDPDKLNPLWNPVRLARDQGRQMNFSGSAGHFVCVDGFGPPSDEERAAGIPMHGEAHEAHYETLTTNEANGSAVTLTAKLPIVQEMFTRTFHIVNGENVVYVDSQLENLLGFDRPVNWGEHATIMAPFLQPNVTSIYLSGTRSQNRNYLLDQGRGSAPRSGGPNAGGRGASAPAAGQNPQAGRGGGVGQQRRLIPGQDFTWPMAPGLDGKPVDLSSAPEDAHFLDHATTLLDPTRALEWVAALNTSRRMVYGYVFRREDYPWLQHWDNYPNSAQLVRGMEFATQPYDVSHRNAVDMHSLFDTPVYRWLPAKSKIESHFLLYYARVPEGFGRVDDVRLENGRLIIEDRSAKKQTVLSASRGLS